MEAASPVPASQQADPALDACLAAHLAAAAGGDVAGFEAFYSATIRLVLPQVRRICGDSHCDDVLSDAYFQAWNTLATFDPGRGSALAWIRMIAGSRARDRMRAERLRHGGADGALDAGDHDEPDGRGGPEQILQAAQACARLRAAVAALPANQRMMIGLAYYRDRTQGEIAQEVGIPLGTVKTLMRDSHSRLHAMLAGEGPEVCRG